MDWCSVWTTGQLHHDRINLRRWSGMLYSWKCCLNFTDFCGTRRIAQQQMAEALQVIFAKCPSKEGQGHAQWLGAMNPSLRIIQTPANLRARLWCRAHSGWLSPHCTQWLLPIICPTPILDQRVLFSPSGWAELLLDFNLCSQDALHQAGTTMPVTNIWTACLHRRFFATFQCCVQNDHAFPRPHFSQGHLGQCRESSNKCRNDTDYNSWSSSLAQQIILSIFFEKSAHKWEIQHKSLNQASIWGNAGTCLLQTSPWFRFLLLQLQLQFKIWWYDLKHYIHI